RRELFERIPFNTIVDDFVIPLLVKQRTRCRIVYDCGAIAIEETASDVAAEFSRRARIGAGGYQAIGMLWRLLDPRRGWISFTFLSHKILRWLCPFALLGMVACNVLLLSHPLFRLTFVIQAIFYSFSFLMMCLPPRLDRVRLLRLAPLFTAMNLALLLGFWRWLRGKQGGTWQRTNRAGMSGEAVAHVASV
ncbi:MAG: glycosyltransferase family 2 protein, partial [Phycisphaerae bacterium]|nr:glycosyltransferase family 2 protein [Phycisphaerae bacterium]